MFEILQNILDAFAGQSRTGSHVFKAYKDEVISFANMPYDKAARRIGNIMYTMNAADKESFANLIKFLGVEISKNGYRAEGAKLLVLHGVAKEISGR